MKVNGKDDIPYIMENKKNVPKHQPVIEYQEFQPTIIMDYHGLPKVYVQLPSAVRDEEPNIIEASRSLQTCWKNIYNG